MKVWKKDSNGTVTESFLMPHEDVGTDSVGAAAEEERYRKLGYETLIIREQHYAKREGGELLK